MSKVPQGNNAAQQDPAPLLTMKLHTINGVNTSSSRIAIPDDKVYNLENIIPIGPQNNHVVDNISGVLVDYGADFIYYQKSANLNNQEYVINFSTAGLIHLFNVSTNTDQVLNPGLPLSGSGSRCDQWKNTVLLFIDSSGYYAYDGSTFQKITGPGVPSSGDDIAVYAGRVWIAQGRLLVNSGANDYTAPSFLATNGAAFNSLTDPQIRSKVQRMIVSNGVLYVVSNTGVNAIYNVQVAPNAVPPTPTYQNDNVQGVIGSDQPASVIPADGGSFHMANEYGVYKVYGVQAPKISDDINGTWQFLDPNFKISAGQVVIEGILCSAFLIKRLNDPVFGSNTVIAIYTQRAAPSAIQSGEIIWWFANFGNITSITSAIVGGVLCLFCMIGNKMYRLFADPSTAPSAVVQTKLYPMEDDLQAKEVVLAGFGAVFSLVGSAISLSVDSKDFSYDTGATVAIQTGPWINSVGLQGQWVNSSNVLGGWFAQSTSLIFASPPPVGSRYIGMTLKTTGYKYELNVMAMDYKLRQRWSVP